ncbi:uncharacterized protein HaLaN_13315, partial [Haematococcus lacustris]
MPGAVVLVIDSLLKVLGGFVVGFTVRDHIARRSPAPIKKKKGGVKAVSVPRSKEELKMVLCVNESLKMGKGKIGAQCAHAAVGVLQQWGSTHAVALKQWEHHGQPKIALKISDDDEMDELERKASDAGLPTYIVHDAGRTQIPAGSQTVLAIGPAPKNYACAGPMYGKD